MDGLIILLVGLSIYPPQRSLQDQGFGPIVQDLEEHAHAGHPMRAEDDPGNWVHELTHQINSDIRNETKAHDNAFYLTGGKYMILPEPNVTLAQVAECVTEKGDFYNLYLIQQQKGWNNEPLYVLDEADAYTNGLLYHAVSSTKDAKRLRGAQEFVHYAKAVVIAVERYDPTYANLEALRGYVKYHEERTNKVIAQYNGLPSPVPSPLIPPYVIW